jgi:uncharacterized protein
MGPVKVKPAVIDTNVIVSALLFGGVPGRLVALWKSGAIEPKASKEIIDEYIKVLAYPKFRLSEEEINFLLKGEILPYFEIVTVRKRPVIIAADPSDDVFLRCAKAARVETIISGDQHLLKLKNWGKLRILSPAEFLETLSLQF